MPSNPKFSFHDAAIYLINDVATNGHVRQDILVRWGSIQSLMKIFENSSNSKLQELLPTQLKTAIANFDTSTTSYIASYLTWGYMGGSARYATYLKTMLTEYEEAVKFDKYAAEHKDSTAKATNATPATTNTTQTETTTVTATSILANAAPNARSYAQAVSPQATNIVSTSSAVTMPNPVIVVSETNELLDAYRVQLKDFAVNVNTTIYKKSATGVKTLNYNQYVAWQLLNVQHVASIYGNSIYILDIKRNVSYLINIIAEFPFEPKKGSITMNLSAPEHSKKLTNMEVACTEQTCTNKDARHELIRKLNLTCKNFTDMIDETLLALKAVNKPLTFNPELIKLFISSIRHMIDNSVTLNPELKLPKPEDKAKEAVTATVASGVAPVEATVITTAATPVPR